MRLIQRTAYHTATITKTMSRSLGTPIIAEV
jgi:hypothetical protein